MSEFVRHSTDDQPLSQEGYQLMSAAFEVHNEVGGGLLEEIYQECLELELAMRGIPFTSKQQLAALSCNGSGLCSASLWKKTADER